MPFEYGDNLTSMLNVLKAHNTMTASPDLSADLTTRIDDLDIKSGDPEIEVQRISHTPSVYVRISNRDDEFSTIGRPGTGSSRVHKQATVEYDVIGFYSKEGATSSWSSLLDEVYNMARNIEGVLNQEYNLSGTALWCAPISTDFFGPFDIDGSWTKTVLIKVKAVYHYR